MIKFITYKTSDFLSKNKKEVEINSLEELLKYIDEQTCWQVVIFHEPKNSWQEDMRDRWIIEDYDYYRE